MKAYVYVLKKRGEDVFYIGSTVGLGNEIRWHSERFPGYELWGQILVDPRTRTVMVGRMITQARIAGWDLVNRTIPPEYGPNDKVEVSSGLLLQVLRRGDLGLVRVWLDVMNQKENPSCD